MMMYYFPPSMIQNFGDYGYDCRVGHCRIAITSQISAHFRFTLLVRLTSGMHDYNLFPFALSLGGHFSLASSLHNTGE